jgi:subfamily B ATP-binding cassette protein HlyB/CyaB
MQMSTAADSNDTSSGLEALVTLLHFQGVAADREQIRHRLGTNKIGASEILRCAKDFGLKARAASRPIRTIGVCAMSR